MINKATALRMDEVEQGHVVHLLLLNEKSAWKALFALVVRVSGLVLDSIKAFCSVH